MFPSNQNNEISFQISSRSNQENIIVEDLYLILGHGAADGTSPSHKNSPSKGRQRNTRSSHREHDCTTENHSKKALHREIEKQRRKEMATLCTWLRNLLPLEYIKGKRAISDHIHETARYIKDLENKIKQLSIQRDEIKEVPNLSHGSSSEKSNNSCCVMVRSCFIGVEVVISCSFGGKVFQLSTVLQLLLKQGLDVVSCISAKVNEKIIYTIQSKVRYMTHIDISDLQHKLIEAISSSNS